MSSVGPFRSRASLTRRPKIIKRAPARRRAKVLAQPVDRWVKPALSRSLGLISICANFVFSPQRQPAEPSGVVQTRIAAARRHCVIGGRECDLSIRIRGSLRARATRPVRTRPTHARPPPAAKNQTSSLAEGATFDRSHSLALNNLIFPLTAAPALLWSRLCRFSAALWPSPNAAPPKR